MVIYSCAGIDDLAAEGPDTDRAIANVMVSSLAGFFGELGTHARGPKDCPLFMNKGRDVKYMIGPQKFDASCRKQMSGKLRKELPALEALLEVFR